MTTSTIMPAIQPIEGEMHSSSLAHLHTAVVDAMHAADEFAKRADAETAPVLRAFHDLNARHDGELAQMIARQGHQPDEHGSFSALLQTGIDRLRDLMGRDDDRMVAQMIDGEREVLDAYAHALNHAGPPETADLLRRQRDELAALVQEHDTEEGASAGARP